jgi:hypothetical protein
MNSIYLIPLFTKRTIIKWMIETLKNPEYILRWKTLNCTIFRLLL